MINEIINAISLSLNAEFGDRYKIYKEMKRQDLQEPCFFISCINPTSRLFLGKRYFRTNQFCIHYFPENKMKEKEECDAVIERLFLCLEWLDADGDVVMGTQMKSEVADGILHFFVNYDMFVYKVSEPVPIMEEIISETSVKEQVE